MTAGEGGAPSLLLSTGETHLECWARFWASQYKRDVDIQKRAQQRATAVMEALQHLSCEKRLRKQGLFILEKRQLRKDLMVERWWGVKNKEPDSS